MSTLGISLIHRGYHEYIGGFSTSGGYDEYMGDSMNTLGDTMNTLGDSMNTLGGYHEYIGECSVHWGFQ